MTEDLTQLTAKCIVHGCTNRKGRGSFDGGICSPCYDMLTTGKLVPSDGFLGRLREDILSLAARVKNYGGGE